MAVMYLDLDDLRRLTNTWATLWVTTLTEYGLPSLGGRSAVKRTRWHAWVADEFVIALWN